MSRADLRLRSRTQHVSKALGACKSRPARPLPCQLTPRPNCRNCRNCSAVSTGDPSAVAQRLMACRPAAVSVGMEYSRFSQERLKAQCLLNLAPVLGDVEARGLDVCMAWRADEGAAPGEKDWPRRVTAGRCLRCLAGRGR